MKDWRTYHYEEVITEDGSPSLKSAHSPEAELMHHRGGAMTESRAIYGRLIEACFSQVKSPRFLSLGLGLGYNEILIAEAAVAAGLNDWSCVSYEADPVLRDALLEYLLVGSTGLEPVTLTYKRIFDKIQNPEEAKKTLLKAYHDKRWVIEPAMTNQTQPPFPINAYLWDAFSQKTSPDLWDEEFLKKFLSHSSDEKSSALTTYACIGKLKRALKETGFRIKICPGFQNKKNSTLAWRGAGWEKLEESIIPKTAEHLGIS